MPAPPPTIVFGMMSAMSEQLWTIATMAQIQYCQSSYSKFVLNLWNFHGWSWLTCSARCARWRRTVNSFSESKPGINHIRSRTDVNRKRWQMASIKHGDSSSLIMFRYIDRWSRYPSADRPVKPAGPAICDRWLLNQKTMARWCYFHIWIFSLSTRLLAIGKAEMPVLTTVQQWCIQS